MDKSKKLTKLSKTFGLSEKELKKIIEEWEEDKPIPKRKSVSSKKEIGRSKTDNKELKYKKTSRIKEIS